MIGSSPRRRGGDEAIPDARGPSLLREGLAAVKGSVLLIGLVLTGCTAEDTHCCWRDLAIGLEHSCGLREDGEVWCWGDDPDITDERRVAEEGEFRALAGSTTHGTCGVTDEDTVESRRDGPSRPRYGLRRHGQRGGSGGLPLDPSLWPGAPPLDPDACGAPFLREGLANVKGTALLIGLVLTGCTSEETHCCWTDLAIRLEHSGVVWCPIRECDCIPRWGKHRSIRLGSGWQPDAIHSAHGVYGKRGIPAV